MEELDSQPTPPGEHIRQNMQDLNISIYDMALRLKWDRGKVEDLLNGKMRINQDIANDLELNLGILSHIILGLELKYRQALAEGDGEELFNQVINNMLNIDGRKKL